MNTMQRQPRKILTAKDAAEALFAKRAAPSPVAAPRILESVPDPVLVENLRLRRQATGAAAPAKESDHQKVFRLVSEAKFKEAARLAKRLIDDGHIGAFFIYGKSREGAAAKDWFANSVATALRSMSTSVHTITPECAQVLLQNNPNNRRIKADNLEYLMRDLTAGAWQPNGETIIVLRNGDVGDGQHRCWATLLTGLSLETATTFGVSETAVNTIDIGAKRTASDRLVMRGQTDAVVVAATASVLFELDMGRKGTEAEIDGFAMEHVDAIVNGITARGTSNIKGIGPSASAATAVILLRKGGNADKIKDFFRVVRTAEMTKAGNPARTLHLAIFPTDRSIKPLRLKRDVMVALLVNHYSAWTRGKKVREPMLDRAMPEFV